MTSDLGKCAVHNRQNSNACANDEEQQHIIVSLWDMVTMVLKMSIDCGE